MNGRVVATEQVLPLSNIWEDEEIPHIREVIIIEGEDVELWLKDLIVAAWCSRIWMSKANRMSFVRGLLKGQGKIGDLEPLAVRIWANYYKLRCNSCPLYLG